MPLQPPSLDGGGEVIPHDHAEILPQDGIIRRISEQQLVVDEKTGGRRISSMALKPSSGPNAGLSVDLQRQIEEAGQDARTFVTTPRWVGSIRFEAAQLRELAFMVGYSPQTDNPFHGEVWGTFSRANQKLLRQRCVWFVQIDNVSIGAE